MQEEAVDPWDVGIVVDRAVVTSDAESFAVESLEGWLEEDKCVAVSGVPVGRGISGNIGMWHGNHQEQHSQHCQQLVITHRGHVCSRRLLTMPF